MTPNQHAFPRTDRTRLSVWWWTTDHLLLGATAILITIGVLLSFGNSPAAAPMSRAAARPPAQAWAGMTVAQPLAWA